MRHFVVSTEGKNKLNLRQACEDFVNDIWVPNHLTHEQAIRFALDYFKRTLLTELELLDVSACENVSASGDGS